MLRTSKTLLALAPLLALVACQDPDVGNPCALSWNTDWDDTSIPLETRPPPPPTASTLFAENVAADYFDSGNIPCEHLICVLSPTNDARFGGESCVDTPGCGYCSKPCVSNDDCFQKETGLVCRQIVLDPVFLDELERTESGRAVKERYLGETRQSSYCGVPR